MPPKRRRVSESTEDAGEGNTQWDNTRTGDSTSCPQPHDELWFDDGSVVLATDVHLYRVHKGMLAKHSTVLSGMFEIPSGDANTECWEDVPIVKMAGDSDEEVYILLKALYNRNFRDTFDGTELPILSSLLSISTKYDFREIRTDVTQFLESIFPSTYEKYKVSKQRALSFNCPQLITLLVVARRCEVLSILPLLFYRCATFPLPTILESIHLLPEDCMSVLLLGRDWLLQGAYYLMMQTLQFDRVGGIRGICDEPLCLDAFV